MSVRRISTNPFSGRHQALGIFESAIYSKAKIQSKAIRAIDFNTFISWKEKDSKFKPTVTQECKIAPDVFQIRKTSLLAPNSHTCLLSLFPQFMCIWQKRTGRIIEKMEMTRLRCCKTVPKITSSLLISRANQSHPRNWSLYNVAH